MSFISTSRLIELAGDIVFDNFMDEIIKEGYDIKTILEVLELWRLHKEQLEEDKLKYKESHELAFTNKDYVILWKDIVVCLLTKLPHRFKQNRLRNHV